MPQTDIARAGGRRLTVPGGLDWITIAGGSPWAANQSLTRLDARTGAVQSTLALPGPACLAPDVGFKALWVGVCGTPQVVRVDPTSSKVVATIPLKVSDLMPESSVAAGAGSVWLLSISNQLVQLDPTTNTVVRTVDAPDGASAIRATDDALWISNHMAGTLLRLDPHSLATVATIKVGAGPRFLAVGDGAVWTLDQTSGTVTRVDATTNVPVVSLKVDSGPIDGGDIAVGGGFVWARVSDGLVAKINPTTNTVVARYLPQAGSGSVAADGTAAWITAHDSNSVFRLPLG